MASTDRSRWDELLPVAAIFGLATTPTLLLGAAPRDLRSLFVVAAFGVAWAMAVRALVQSRRFPMPIESLALAVAAGFTLLQALPVGSFVAGLLGGASFDRAGEALRATGVDEPWRFLSYEPAATLAEGIRLWAWALVLAAFVALSGRRGSRRTILGAVALQGALQAVAGVAAYFFDLDVRTLFTHNPLAMRPGFHGTFLNDNHAAAAFNLAAFAFLGLALEAEWRRRVFWSACAIAMATCTLAVDARAGSVVLVLTALLFLGWLRWVSPNAKSTRPLAVQVLLAVGIIAATVLAFAAVDQFTFQYLGESNIDQAVAGKTSIWGPALRLVADHPWAGVGRGAFAVAVSAYNDTDPTRTYDYVENAPLQWLADWGIPFGGAAIVVIAFLGVRLLLAVSDRRTLLAAMFGVVAVAMQNLVDFSIEVPGVALPVLAILGAAIAHRSGTAGKRGLIRKNLPARTAIFVTTFSLMLILPLRWADDHSLDAAREHVERVAREARTEGSVPAVEVDSALADETRLHPLDAFLYDVGARIALAQNRSDQAASLADAALLLFPRSLTANLLRAEADRALGRTDDATRRLANLVELRPDAEKAIFGFLLAGQWRDVDVAHILTGPSGAFERYVESLVQARRNRKAIGVLRARLQEVPGDRTSLRQAGRLLIDAGDIDGANTMGVRLLALYPAEPDGWLLSARVAGLQDQHLEALTLYREAAQRTQDRTEADLGALRCLLLLGRGVEFDELAHQLEGRIGRNVYGRSDLLQLLASHEARLGRFSVALDHLERAERLIPSDPSIPFARAHIRLQAGDREGARRDLRRVLSLDPLHRLARQELIELDDLNRASPPITP